MKKKLVAFLLSMTMCAGMLAGCGSKETENNASSSESQAAQSQETETQGAEVQSTEAEKPQEITNIVVYYRASAQNSEKAIIEAMNEYSAEKIGVTITYTPIESSEYKDKLSMDLAAQTEMDLCWMANYTGLQSLAEQGALMELTDILGEYEDLYNVMPEKIWESTEYGGNRYFVPNYKESFTSYSVMTPAALADTVKDKYGIDFNEIECNGIEELENYEEYILACMKEGVEFPIPNLVRFYTWLSGDSRYEVLNGIYIADKETHTVTTYYETPEFAEYVELMQRWNDLGIRLEESLLSDFKFDPYLKSGSYAISGWTTVPDNQNQASIRYGVDAYVKEVTQKTVINTSATGAGWAIPQYSEKADAVMKWLTLLNTDTEFANLFVYGLEGQNYTVESDGRIAVNTDAGWSNSAWKVTNYLVPSLSTADALDKKEQYDLYNNEAVEMVHLGFRPDLTALSAETATITAIDKEVGTMFDIGLYGVDKLEETIADMNKAGLEKVKAEIQKQLDEFLASK